MNFLEIQIIYKNFIFAMLFTERLEEKAGVSPKRGRGQEAGGRRQETGGRGQEAGGRRQEVESIFFCPLP